MPGDVIVLTKPLGTQAAVNAHQWLEDVSWMIMHMFIFHNEHLCSAQVVGQDQGCCYRGTRCINYAFMCAEFHAWLFFCVQCSRPIMLP